MYIIVFNKFPNEFEGVDHSIKEYPKPFMSVLGTYVTIGKAREMIRELSTEYVTENYGRIAGEKAWITDVKPEYFQNGFNLYQPSCDMIDIYEKQSVILEGYVYNSYKNMYRHHGWMEILSKTSVTAPSPPPLPYNIPSQTKSVVTMDNVIDELKEFLLSGDVLKPILYDTDDTWYSSDEE